MTPVDEKSATFEKALERVATAEALASMGLLTPRELQEAVDRIRADLGLPPLTVTRAR